MDKDKVGLKKQIIVHLQHEVGCHFRPQNPRKPKYDVAVLHYKLHCSKRGLFKHL